jgi:hypothetical protein
VGGACSTNWRENAIVGKPEGKRPLGRPILRFVDLVEIGWGGVNWIGLAQNRGM